MVHQCTDTYGNRAWLQAGIVSHITVLSSEHQHLCPLWALSTRSQAHTLEKTGTQCWWKSPLICFWSLGQSIPAKPDQLHCKYKKKLQRPETKVQKMVTDFPPMSTCQSYQMLLELQLHHCCLVRNFSRPVLCWRLDSCLPPALETEKLWENFTSKYQLCGSVPPCFPTRKVIKGTRSLRPPNHCQSPQCHFFW